jgi:hypothetical protein
MYWMNIQARNKLFLQPSELGTTPPPLGSGEGQIRLQERGWWGPNSYEGTDTVVLCPKMDGQKTISRYTVSRANCIWQNENGSCEAGPDSKYW